MDRDLDDADSAGLLNSDAEYHSQHHVASFSRPFRREPSPTALHSNIVQPGTGTSTFHSYSTGSQSTNSGNATPRFLGAYNDASARRSFSDASVHSSSQFSLASNAEKAALDAMPPGTVMGLNFDEDEDDWLHDPGYKGKARTSESATSLRGILNVGTLLLILCCLLMLFLGYPVVVEISKLHGDGTASSSLSTTNVYTTFPAQMKRGLIDQDTPQSVYDRVSPVDQSEWHLVFSDEFNTPGRTFYPGDDPFWQAYEGWYSGTNDYEYYSPDAINTTDDGYLQISFEERQTHNLNFRSGMLQSWNKMCFTGAYLEIRAQLPGSPNVAGFWPGVSIHGS